MLGRIIFKSYLFKSWFYVFWFQLQCLTYNQLPVFFVSQYVGLLWLTYVPVEIWIIDFLLSFLSTLWSFYSYVKCMGRIFGIKIAIFSLNLLKQVVALDCKVGSKCVNEEFWAQSHPLSICFSLQIRLWLVVTVLDRPLTIYSHWSISPVAV